MARLVWITGASGLIGHAITKGGEAHSDSWNIRSLQRSDLDLTDFKAVRSLYHKEKPTAIIHCAAQSRTGICEKDPQGAEKVNVAATACLADLGRDIQFLFFSSDLVFDGLKGNYTESDAVNPVSRYGETKARAEEIVLTNPKHIVVRTSLNFGFSREGGRSFNEELMHRWEKGEKISFFTDEFRCPIPVQATAGAVWDLLERNASGLFHLAGSEKLSRWVIGQILCEVWPQYRPLIKPESLKNFKGPKRPPDTSLNCDRITKVLSTPLPSFSNWIQQHKQEISSMGKVPQNSFHAFPP